MRFSLIRYYYDHVYIVYGVIIQLTHAIYLGKFFSRKALWCGICSKLWWLSSVLLLSLMLYANNVPLVYKLYIVSIDALLNIFYNAYSKVISHNIFYHVDTCIFDNVFSDTTNRSVLRWYFSMFLSLNYLSLPSSYSMLLIYITRLNSVTQEQLEKNYKKKNFWEFCCITKLSINIAEGGKTHTHTHTLLYHHDETANIHNSYITKLIFYLNKCKLNSSPMKYIYISKCETDNECCILNSFTEKGHCMCIYGISITLILFVCRIYIYFHNPLTTIYLSWRARL